ncbi:ribosomal protein S18-alanine N-acetyltransferase [Mordavella massiliensis]|uniref:ribosomal protein S18-alanine N-acetyltransferase n=1 Tax=Mordavella massiliensis TaxID=1871024 RepID=UPI00210C1C73|nr:ribosomal protein S18-alanine N-acetyltransferase [Mordavella massiliensis]
MLTIRRMKESDIPEVARLEKEIFPDPWSEGAISETFGQEQTLLLVAYEDRKLIGYLILYFVLEEGEIARIAVIPECRRQGVGARMLLELEDLCEDNGITKLLLDVRESNETAISFYTSYGFVQDGVRRNFYSDPQEDGILMSREIGK